MSRSQFEKWGRGNSGSPLYADLGPTNTGKTHRAIQRMLELKSGMIGLPLRLLAREIYDRLCKEVPAQDVALITGEERILPHGYKFIVCTVESMPMDQHLPIIIIDEIQLATHPKRGHIFTDRILRARGIQETWFLGSDTMKDLLLELLPTTIIHQSKRFSQLSYVQPKRLNALPKRSAIISFNINHLYELAERIRNAKGGVALVMGAMSPQARNAQVDLFQSGKVDYLVATDAIGLGLNLELKHVCFASIAKFDGRDYRQLTWAEMGQIAGRAGRFENSGTFNLSIDAQNRYSLSETAIEAIEQQQFLPIRKVYWRNHDISFESIEDFWLSLQKRPFAGCLIPQREALDELAMNALLKDDDVLPLINHPKRLQQLWELCRIPDYAIETQPSHFRFIKTLFLQIVKNKKLDSLWVFKELKKLHNLTGDIPKLLHQMARIRTWRFISHREQWVKDAAILQDQLSHLEELISNTVHQRLTERFIDEINTRQERTEPIDPYIEHQELWCQQMQLGVLDGFAFSPSFEAQNRFGSSIVRKLGLQFCAPLAKDNFKKMLEDRNWQIDYQYQIVWQNQVLGRIIKGSKIREPKIILKPAELLDTRNQYRLRVEIEDWLMQQITTLLLLYPSKDDGTRDLRFDLRQNIGVVPSKDYAKKSKQLQGPLRKSKIHFGQHFIYHRDIFKPKYQSIRFLLWSLQLDLKTIPELPDARTCFISQWPKGFAKLLGYHIYAGYTIRTDIIEKICQDSQEHNAMPKICSRLGMPQKISLSIVKAMGLSIS